MSKAGYTKTFGAPKMRDLRDNANVLGIEVDFVINSDGKYCVVYNNIMNVCPTVAAACTYIMGMMAMVGTPTGAFKAADNTVQLKEDLINTINTDPMAVGEAIKILFTRHCHYYIHHALFAKCVKWMNRGNVLNGKALREARAALLNYYLDSMIKAKN